MPLLNQTKGAVLLIIILMVAACTSSIDRMQETQIDNFIKNENQITGVVNIQEMNVSSPDFGQDEMIPARFTCDGDDISPEIDISGIPDKAKSLVLIMDDPDAPMGTWDHWVMFDIPVTERIKESSAPGVQGKNSWGRNGYGGPCPPNGTHRYFFKVYALDRMLGIKDSSTKKDVMDAMMDSVIGEGRLVGLYSRQ